MKTMWAAQYEKEVGKPLVHQIPIPKPSNGQLLVKISAASLCHSDLMTSLRPDNIGPVTIGHEGVGTVAEVTAGAEGKGFRVGDRVGMLSMVDACHDCEGCALHDTFCVRPRNGGAKVQGLDSHGCFAEYAVIGWENAILLPESLPIERMSPLFCAGLTAFHAVDKCELKPGQWIAVVGCGGLGTLAVRYAKAMGLKVAAFDINSHMLDVAKRNGADAIFDPNTRFQKSLRSLTGTRGCHAAAVFSDAMAAYATAQRCLDFNGILMVSGIPDQPLQFPAVHLALGLYRIKGASNGTAKEMKKAVEFTAKHHIIPDVEFRRLEEMPQMWEELASGRAKKKLVVVFGKRDSKM